VALKELTLADAIEISGELKRPTWFANPLFLLHNCLWDMQNGELVLYEKTKIDGRYPLMFLPGNPDDHTDAIVSTGFDEDIAVIERTHVLNAKEVLGLEYYYSTDEWIALDGPRFKDIRKQISKFERENAFTVLEDYPREKILAFLDEWAAEKRSKDVPELTRTLFEHELQESKENLEVLGRFEHKKLFMEISGQLAGFAVFIPYLPDLWVALMQKTKHGVRGLPQMLYHLKAKRMQGIKRFTTGAEAQDPQLKEFKESLRPIEVKTIYVLKIGRKK